MKFLHVIGSMDPRGGGTTAHVFSSARVWSRLGHEVHVLSLDPPNAPCVAAAPLTVIALGGKGRLTEFDKRLSAWARYGYRRALGVWLKANARAYDAILLNGLWNYTSYGTWRALKNTGVPYYVWPHGMLDPWLKHASPASHLLRELFWAFFEQKVCRDARAIIFACEEEKRLADESFLRDRCQCYVAGFGSEDVEGDPNRQTSAFYRRFPSLINRRAALFVGRIHPKKGLDLLIKAFARLAHEHPELDLVIAGPGDDGLMAQLKTLAACEGIAKRIYWTGMLSGDAKWGAFRSAEFFVLPSHQENFGISVVEALSLSLPVLVTRKVNIWREIEASNAGVVTTDDVDGVELALRSMLHLSPSERASMAERARHAFLERFDLGKTAPELLGLIIEMNSASGVPKRQPENKMTSGRLHYPI